MNPQQYRQYQQAGQNRSPATTRRPGQTPATAQQLVAQQAQLQADQARRQNDLLAYQLTQRRARKPTDKNMPDGIEDIIIGDGVQQYKELREQERRLDYAMTRKRLDMQENMTRQHKRQKTLRLFISNTVENQIWQNPPQDFSAAAQHSFARVRIEGRLVDEPDDEATHEDTGDTDDEEQTTTTKPARKKMSSFFKSMTVEFDKNRNNVPDPKWQVDWKKTPNSPNADVDVIEFKRKCEANMNINLSFVRDEQPERYRLSPALAQTLDMEEADRTEVVMALWDYIRFMGLQEDEEKRSVRCDDQLRRMLNREQFYFPQLPELIMHHLHPLPPLKLAYTIRVDQTFHQQQPPPQTIYDIQVPVESPLRTRAIAMTQNPTLQANLRSIGQLDDQLAIVIQALQTSKARHNFYRGLAKDPVTFTKRWMSSQRRDLEVILGEAARGGGEDGSGPEFARGGKEGVWGSEAVGEAVRYLLARPIQKA